MEAQDYRDLLDLKEAELDSLRLELEESKGHLHLEMARTLEQELGLELEKEVSRSLQLEQEKKQLETTVNGLRVVPTQLELYSRNKDLEEFKEASTKETSKLRKEGNSLGLQKRKLEADLEEAKKTCTQLETDFEAAKGLISSLGTEVKRLMGELETIQEAADRTVGRAKEALRVSGLKEPSSARPSLLIPLPIDPPTDISESQTLAALDRLIRQLSQGSLT